MPAFEEYSFVSRIRLIWLATDQVADSLVVSEAAVDSTRKGFGTRIILTAVAATKKGFGPRIISTTVDLQLE